jgi:hypothetical protein
VELDGRLLPGYKPEDMFDELRPIIGREVELELIQYDPGPAEPDMGLFDILTGILREADPEGIPVPFLLSGVTDARFFSRLGIQTYGYLPMQLPGDFNFIQIIHAANERIPAERRLSSARVRSTGHCRDLSKRIAPGFEGLHTRCGEARSGPGRRMRRICDQSKTGLRFTHNPVLIILLISAFVNLALSSASIVSTSRKCVIGVL